MSEVKRIILPHILHTISGADTAHYITEITFVRLLQQTSMGPIITFTGWPFFNGITLFSVRYELAICMYNTQQDNYIPHWVNDLAHLSRP